MSMKGVSEVEVYHIQTNERGSFAHISYRQDGENRDTDGYNHIIVPLDLRPIQLSSRGNSYVNQTRKSEPEVATEI